jgi:hypothetical protein
LSDGTSEGCRPDSSYGLSIDVGPRDGWAEGELGSAVAAAETGWTNRWGRHLAGGLGRRSRSGAAALALGDEKLALGVAFKVRRAGRTGLGAGAKAVGGGTGIEAATACSSGAPGHEGPDGPGRTRECIKQSAPVATTPRINSDASIAFVEMAPGGAATRALRARGRSSSIPMGGEDSGDASRPMAFGVVPPCLIEGTISCACSAKGGPTKQMARLRFQDRRQPPVFWARPGKAPSSSGGPVEVSGRRPARA